MTLEETCTELQKELQKNYVWRKANGKGGDYLILRGDMDVFMQNHPESKQYEFDIEFGYEIDRVVYGNPMCGNGCCYPWDRAWTKGVYVRPRDWIKIKEYADFLDTACLENGSTSAKQPTNRSETL